MLFFSMQLLMLMLMLGDCFTGSVLGVITCCKLAYYGNKCGQDDPATVAAEEG